MPLYYTAPNVRTEQYTPETVPEPVANALQKGLHQYISVPVEPMYMRVPGIIYPGVPRDYGWSWGQHDLDNKYRKPWPWPPLQSPGVTYVPTAVNAGIAQAARPQPTASYTGVHRALRAPGINEGY